jgi:mRNA interferase YafQ
MLKRGKQRARIEAVVELLAADQPLPERCRPHKLVGEWTGFWECHIEPDWLLVYDLDDPDTLTLVATGTHADLFR